MKKKFNEYADKRLLCAENATIFKDEFPNGIRTEALYFICGPFTARIRYWSASNKTRCGNISFFLHHSKVLLTSLIQLTRLFSVCAPSSAQQAGKCRPKCRRAASQKETQSVQVKSMCSVCGYIELLRPNSWVCSNNLIWMSDSRPALPPSK